MEPVTFPRWERRAVVKWNPGSDYSLKKLASSDGGRQEVSLRLENK